MEICLCCRKPCSLAEPPTTVRMGSKPTKIQGPGTALTFLGVIWPGKTHIVPESITDKDKPIVTTKCERGIGFCGNLGVLVNIYSPFSIMLSAILSPGLKGPYMGLGSQTTGCL